MEVFLGCGMSLRRGVASAGRAGPCGFCFPVLAYMGLRMAILDAHSGGFPIIIFAAHSF